MKTKNLPFVLLGLAITVLCLAIYYSSLHFGFVSYDDPTYLLENDGVIHFDFKKIFSPLASAYSPLTFLSYAIEHSFIQFQPFYYHLTNLVLHILNAILATYFVFRISSKNFLLAAFVGLLFAAHPLRVESVVWVTERKDVLSIFFYLLALIFYVRFVEKDKWGPYFTSFVFFIFSVLSKSTSVSLPLLLIACDFFYRRAFSKRTVFEKVPFFLFSIAMTVFQKKLLDTPASPSGPLTINVVDALNSFVFYIGKSFAPLRLSVFYERSAVDLSVFDYSLAAVFALFLGLVYFKRKDSRREIVFGMGFFALAVLPVSQIIPFGTGFVFADRYMYLPSIGFFFATGHILLRLMPRNLFIATLAISATALSYTSYERSKVWSSSETLWQDVLDKYPRSSVASNNLGIEKFQQKRYKDAVVHFAKAVSVNPLYIEAFNNLGGALTATQDFEGAARAYKSVLAIKPEDAGAHYGLGNIYTLLGRTVDAKSEYLLALNAEPNHLSALLNLGLTYMKEGLKENAKMQFVKVLELKPDHEKAKKALELLR